MSLFCKLFGHDWTVGFHIDPDYDPTLVLEGHLCHRCDEFTVSKEKLHEKLHEGADA